MQTDKDIVIRFYDVQENKAIDMKLDEAVEKILEYEIIDYFELEVLKALSVAIRTKIVKELKIYNGGICIKTDEMEIYKYEKKNYLVSQNIALDLNQIKQNMKEKVHQAVISTSGIIITYADRPINAEYHIACGGGTENSENVFKNSVIYLRKVLCDYCIDSKYSNNEIVIPIEEIENILNVKLHDNKCIDSSDIKGIFEEVQKDETDRITKIKIGGKYFTGNEIKKCLGLNSSRFKYEPASIRFITKGYGSGLGICIYGANNLAKQGYKYSDILNYYYTCIDIKQMESLSQKEPLEGKCFVIDPSHGGEDLGDQKGILGTLEKDINLYIAKILCKLLQKNGASVFMTREKDEDISLQKRVEFINNIKPNFLFVIHQNTFFSPNISGTDVLYYKGDSEGEKMAKFIVDEIANGLNTKNRGIKQADNYVLRESRVSSVVIECMHITNAKEEKLLMDDLVKNKISEAICEGILKYYCK